MALLERYAPVMLLTVGFVALARNSGIKYATGY